MFAAEPTRRTIRTSVTQDLKLPEGRLINSTTSRWFPNALVSERTGDDNGRDVHLTFNPQQFAIG